MSRPSWQDFATHDESAYPELWNGVVGAWAPCLGPTGSRLHDMSRRSNWGTLTNMDNATDWVIDGGQYALDFDGINDRVESRNFFNQNNSAFGSLSIWFRRRTISQDYISVLDGNGGTGPTVFFLASGLVAATMAGGNNFPYGAISAAATVANTWHHVAVTQARNIAQIWLDGVRGSSYDTGVNTIAGTANFRIGCRALDLFFDGQADDVCVWQRVLAENEVRQLYQLGRGGMYQRRRRRRLYAAQAGFQAAWALRRSQIIGGGLR